MSTRRLRVVVVAVSCVGMLMPTAAMAAPKVVSIAKVAEAPHDVALHEGGVLVGQILDAQGVAIAGVPVLVQKAGKEVTRVNTDKDGKFTVASLQGGVYQVVAVGQQSVYRLWAPRTAPPAAQRGLMLVPSTDVVRGQCGCGTPVCGSACGAGGGGGVYGGGGGGGIGNWMANHPLVTAGAIGAAIAIPLALDDDDPPATP